MAESLEGLHVLVVDDERDVRNATAHLIRAHGAKVVVAGTATDALDILELLAIDVVVSDIDMPGHDGFWFIGELRSRPSLSSIPVIAFTGRGDVDRERISEAGFASHVVKTNPAMLLATMKIATTTRGRIPRRL